MKVMVLLGLLLTIVIIGMEQRPPEQINLQLRDRAYQRYTQSNAVYHQCNVEAEHANTIEQVIREAHQHQD